MGQIESFGKSSTPANEVALQRVGELMQEIQPGGMVQKFVLMVETIDGEDRWLSSFTAPGQKAWDTMGMLQYGLSFEQNFQSHSDPLDEEDDADG